MLKKILIGIGILLLTIGGYIGYTMAKTKSHSPADIATYKDGELEVIVKYCQPFKKERLIFGNESEGALVPFGAFWRLGANEATEITFSQDIDFGGEMVKKGSYRMYAIPGASTWTIRLNSELGQWGSGDTNHDLDVTSISVPVRGIEMSIEQFTIEFAKTARGFDMVFKWDQTLISVPLKAVSEAF